MKKSRHAIWFHDRIERELPKLRSRARSLTNSEPAADDLLQETVKNALSSPLSDGKGHNIRGWLFTIMRHAYVDTIRRNNRRPGDDAGDADPEHLVAGVIGQRPELQIDLLRALDSLNSEHREVITLIGINGLTYDEAAEVLGVSMDAIRSRLFRARSALRSAMNGRNPGSLPSARGPESR